MTRRPNAKNLGLQLTPEQYAAIETAAQAQGIDRAQYVRQILAAHVPNFPADAIPKRGTYQRRKQNEGE